MVSILRIFDNNVKYYTCTCKSVIRVPSPLQSVPKHTNHTNESCYALQYTKPDNLLSNHNNTKASGWKSKAADSNEAVRRPNGAQHGVECSTLWVMHLAHR